MADGPLVYMMPQQLISEDFVEFSYHFYQRYLCQVLLSVLPLSVFSSQSLNLRGRRGTTDDIATIPLQPSLSSAALRESPNFIPTHSISSSVFLHVSFLLLSLSPAELSLHAGGS